MVDPRPHGVPPAAVPPRTAPSRTGLFLVLGLLLFGGILWWAFAANDRDDDVAVYQTTLPGRPAVTRTEVDTTTRTSDAVTTARAPMAVETPAPVTTTTDLAVTTTTTAPAPVPVPAEPAVVAPRDEEADAPVAVTTPESATPEVLADTVDTPEVTTDVDESTTVGTTGGTTAGGEVALSALEQDIERFVGQTVTTTVTVRQLETLRGFWAESGSDRVFAVMPKASNDRLDQELQEGQQVRVTATVVDADDAADMPELADMVDNDGRFMSGEEAVLRVTRIEILDESATR